MIVSFRHKGLEELYWTGKTRRISATSVRKCLRILQILDIAVDPADLDMAGLHFHPLKGTPPALVGAGNRELPRDLRLVE